MPTYEYEIQETGEIIEVTQSIKDDKLTTLYSPELRKEMPCVRIISDNQAGGFILKGDGWTPKYSGYGKRGYKGKFQNKIRETGTPVDAPANKSESDRFFQQQINAGMLDKVPTTLSVKPQTTEQMLDKKHGVK